MERIDGDGDEQMEIARTKADGEGVENRLFQWTFFIGDP
jgi:hypothetical protein